MFTSEHNIAQLHTLHNQFAIFFCHVKLCCLSVIYHSALHIHSNHRLDGSRLACPHQHPPPYRDHSRKPRLQVHLKSQSRWKTLLLTYLHTTASAASSDPIYQVDQILPQTALPMRLPHRAHHPLHPQPLQAPSSSKSKDRRLPQARTTRSQVSATRFSRTRRTCRSNQPTSATSLKKSTASVSIRST